VALSPCEACVQMSVLSAVARAVVMTYYELSKTTSACRTLFVLKKNLRE
jgi:hypothetical protein